MLRIAVIGATGQQGSGVVSALLKTADYAVRAISSNPASAKAQALLDTHKQAAQAGRFALVHGDLTKPDTLRDALQGTYGVFFASPSIPAGQEDAQNSEEAKQGRGVVDAAKVRFISLPPCPEAEPAKDRLQAASISSTPASTV